MAWFPFKFKRIPKNFLGIDIGTSAIRVVELSRKGQAILLANYGEVKSESFQTFSNEQMARAIKAVLREAKIPTREANFSIPDYSSFLTSFELPPMLPKEIAAAVRYEARGYIPLPLSEITLDWQVIEGNIYNKTKTPLKILVAAIPNDVVNQYRQIAALSELELRVLEAEVFALSRSLAKNEKLPVCIIDIGARSTTASIFENGILKISHSFNVSGNELTEILSRSLRIDYQEAEELKKNSGLSGFEESERNIREILLPLIDSIMFETKKTFRNFYQQEGKEVKKLILAGGSAQIPGLKEYFLEELNSDQAQSQKGQIAVEIANPFSDISFPPILEELLKEMGPAYAIAVGLAMKGLE